MTDSYTAEFQDLIQRAYARLLIARRPEWADAIETRTLRAA